MDKDFRSTEFYFDSDPDTTFPGYTKGEEWNGWACPYFEREVAERIAKRYVEMHEDGPDEGYEAKYDSERDAFVFYEPVYEEPIVFNSVEIDGKKLYAVGAYHWTWREK